LLGANLGLLTVGTDRGHWVVPAIHTVWIPPRHVHSLRSHGAFAGWSVYVAEAACGLVPAQPCTMRTSGLLREAVRRAATWRTESLDAGQVRVTKVILDEIRSLPREPMDLLMPADPRLIRIARAIADDLADNRSLAMWANWAGVPSRTLTRRFRIETGFSLGAWRQRAKLMRSLEMLAAREAVTAIALDLGYENVSAFIAMFRRAFGVTPAKYFGRASRS
jgi:AraC-like DNA-binding protein